MYLTTQDKYLVESQIIYHRSNQLQESRTLSLEVWGNLISHCCYIQTLLTPFNRLFKYFLQSLCHILYLEFSKIMGNLTSLPRISWRDSSLLSQAQDEKEIRKQEVKKKKTTKIQTTFKFKYSFYRYIVLLIRSYQQSLRRCATKIRNYSFSPVLV